MTHQGQSLGQQEEELACRELRCRGYAILARRYRTRFGELDVIARDHGVLVFVEVKTRRSDSFGGATAAVGFQKQRRLINMARSYFMGIGGKPPSCRFDVVGVTVAAGERPVSDVIVNAFVGS